MTQVWIDAFVEAKDMHIGMVDSLGIIGILFLLLSIASRLECRPLGPSSLFARWEEARSRSYAVSCCSMSIVDGL